MQFSDEYWMQFALAEAQTAFFKGEVPIGAVLVKDNEAIASAHNLTKNNSLNHAEKLVIEKVISRGEKYLNDYVLYVTVEPCLMCAGVIIW